MLIAPLFPIKPHVPAFSPSVPFNVQYFANFLRTKTAECRPRITFVPMIEYSANA